MVVRYRISVLDTPYEPGAVLFFKLPTNARFARVSAGLGVCFSMKVSLGIIFGETPFNFFFY